MTWPSASVNVVVSSTGLRFSSFLASFASTVRPPVAALVSVVVAAAVVAGVAVFASSATAVAANASIAATDTIVVFITLPLSLSTRAAEPVFAARGRRQRVDLLDRGAHHRRYDQLRNAFLPLDREALAREVHEDHLALATKIAVDRAGRVRDGDAVLRREPRPRTDLAFVAGRDLDREAGRDHHALARSERHGARRVE